MKTRLRPAHSPALLKAIYPRPHDHRIYGRGHGERVQKTIEVGRRLVPLQATIADLSCGNAVIAYALGGSKRTLGDFAPGYEHHGPIEETILKIDPVDLFICSETIEHLDDPDLVLGLIRGKCRMLLLSTPVDNWDDTNAEHYWAWSKKDVEEMVESHGFVVLDHAQVDSREYGEPYCYGIWLLS